MCKTQQTAAALAAEGCRGASETASARQRCVCAGGDDDGPHPWVPRGSRKPARSPMCRTAVAAGVPGKRGSSACVVLFCGVTAASTPARASASPVRSGMCAGCCKVQEGRSCAATNTCEPPEWSRKAGRCCIPSATCATRLAGANGVSFAPSEGPQVGGMSGPQHTSISVASCEPSLSSVQCPGRTQPSWQGGRTCTRAEAPARAAARATTPHAGRPRSTTRHPRVCRLGRPAQRTMHIIAPPGPACRGRRPCFPAPRCAGGGSAAARGPAAGSCGK